ncbi:MAG: hypothetical protein K2M50_04310, partial [Treponemataceae bacterium]|nr:hypothetical protein [Treponemataceae bacterium]
VGGGVVLFAILALSLTLASCADNSDTDEENPTPALPANVGENPIKETIKLKRDTYSSYFLELNTDGTARAIYVDDDEESRVEEIEIRSTYKYSYDNEKETITMIVEKSVYYTPFGEEKVQLLTYDEICSELNKDYTVEKMKQDFKQQYEKDKNDEWFKENYPDCNTYEKYEKAILKESGFDSFSAYAEYVKQSEKDFFKSYFSAKITYAYEREGDKMTLTEKFTGVKNLSNSRCRFSDGSNYASIGCYSASIDYYNDSSVTYYYGNSVDTNNKTVKFVSEGDRKDVITATYTEDIEAETVTINFKGKDYVCKFEGDKYIQVE